jgi:hypothetical protein
MFNGIYIKMLIVITTDSTSIPYYGLLCGLGWKTIEVSLETWEEFTLVTIVITVMFDGFAGSAVILRTISVAVN